MDVINEKKVEYKKTSLGLIPVEWKLKLIGDIVETIKIPYKYQRKEYETKGDFPIVDQGKKPIISFCNDESTLVQDIPLVLFGDHTKEVKYIDFLFGVGGDGTKLLKSKWLETNYLFQTLIFASHRLPNLGYSRHFSELKNISVPIPLKEEQKKILKILTLWDRLIKLKIALLHSSKILKKGLELSLFKGEIRFKEFTNSYEKTKTKIGIIPVDWNLKEISKIINRVKDSLKPIENENYRQIGIRSHCKGIFYKEAVSGESLGSKSVFWIQPDCFIVNIVFAWEHAIAKTTINEVGMIASHRFPMYKPNKDLDLDYLLFFFKTKMGKHLLELASPGGAGRNKTLGQNEFLKLKIPVPQLQEQQKIVSVLTACDTEIDLIKSEIEALKKQKKGLMQQLLTGQIRVKV